MIILGRGGGIMVQALHPILLKERRYTFRQKYFLRGFRTHFFLLVLSAHRPLSQALAFLNYVSEQRLLLASHPFKSCMKEKNVLKEKKEQFWSFWAEAVIREKLFQYFWFHFFGGRWNFKENLFCLSLIV